MYYAENIDDLEDLNKNSDFKRKFPETVKQLILKERDTLQTYQKAKILRQLRQSR